jgi:sorbitol-specific phosphotransferase system component IIA
MIQRAVARLAKKTKRAKVGSKSSDVLEWKVLILFDETTGPHLHPI